MKKVLNAALLACSTVVGSAAAADVHDVIVLRYGYLPERVYAQPGDQIRFINESPNWVRILSNNAYDNYSNYNSNNPCANTGSFEGSQDGWATGWIARGSSTTITVTECMEDEIEAPSIYQYNYYNGYNEAWIEFGTAPNGF